MKKGKTELYLATEMSMDWPFFETRWTFARNYFKAEWEVNQQDGEEEFKCYTIWQVMLASLHSNGQLRTERDGDRERMSKTCCTAEDYWWWMIGTLWSNICHLFCFCCNFVEHDNDRTTSGQWLWKADPRGQSFFGSSTCAHKPELLTCAKHP